MMLTLLPQRHFSLTRLDEAPSFSVCGRGRRNLLRLLRKLFLLCRDCGFFFFETAHIGASTFFLRLGRDRSGVELGKVAPGLLRRGVQRIQLGLMRFFVLLQPQNLMLPRLEFFPCGIEIAIRAITFNGQTLKLHLLPGPLFDEFIQGALRLCGLLRCLPPMLLEVMLFHLGDVITDALIPSRSGRWSFSTISGNPKRGTGILNNELYIGLRIWNRQRFVKDPETGKRQARLNAPEAWVIAECPG
ncbi:hypothetical protein WDB86_15165 (plasmid) [Thioclava sp. GXIMD4215]